MKLEAFIDYVTYVVEKEIPAVLLSELNMGIRVNPKKQEDDEERDYYIMGEYIQDELGCGVVLYYGSFRYFLEDASPDLWQKEIMDTIKHELIHHVEAMAGQEDLALQEDLEVLHRKKSKSKKSSHKNISFNRTTL